MGWNEEARISCRFRFKCLQTWDRLLPSDVEGVRHCPECERDVHLALTEEDFRRHSEDDRCIAMRVVPPDRQADPDMPAYWAEEPAGPYNRWLRRA